MHLTVLPSSEYHHQNNNYMVIILIPLTLLLLILCIGLNVITVIVLSLVPGFTAMSVKTLICVLVVRCS